MINILFSDSGRNLSVLEFQDLHKTHARLAKIEPWQLSSVTIAHLILGQLHNIANPSHD